MIYYLSEIFHRANCSELIKMKSTLFSIVFAAILCLTGCRQKTESISAPPPAPGNPWVYFNQSGLSGVDGEASALTCSDSTLYVGGTFNLAGKVKVRNIAAWNGHIWSALGEGCKNQVVQLAANKQGSVYALSSVYPYPTIEKWDGDRWQTIADTIRGTIDAMHIDSSGALLITGNLSRINGVDVENAARYDGTAWSAFTAPGPLFSNSQRQLFAGAINSEETEFQVYRGSEQSWVEFGTALTLENTLNKFKLCLDGSQRIVLIGQSTDDEENTRSFLARLDSDGVWKTVPLNRNFSNLDFLLPVANDSSRLWIGSEGCLYVFESDSLKTFECHCGPLLIQMNNGQLVTAGKRIYTRSGSQVFIAKMVENDWVGVDSTGVDIFAPSHSLRQKKWDLFQKIPKKDRPVYLAESNMDDIQADKNGGLYLAGSFYFDMSGAYFNHLAYWKNNSFTPLGGGLCGQGGGGFYGGIKLALAPDGAVYAANASVLVSVAAPGLYRYDGAIWRFVRKTPRVAEMVCDRNGDLYALVTTDNSYRNSFCRIPLDSPNAPIEFIAKYSDFDLHGLQHIEIDDSLIHLYGDFLRADSILSIGHVGWRLPPKRDRPKIARAASHPSDNEPIKIVFDVDNYLSILDTSRVRQEGHFYLYNSTPRSRDTVSVLLRYIDDLRMESCDRSSWHTIPAAEYTVTPRKDGYLVKVYFRDSITPRNNVPLNITITRKVHMTKTSSDTYLFIDTIQPLVANLYDNGNDSARVIRIYGGRNLKILDQPKDMDFVFKDIKSPVSLNLKVKRDDE
jgi:hypothetical protein